MGVGSGIGCSFVLELVKCGGDVICVDIDLSLVQEMVDLIQLMIFLLVYVVYCDVGLKEFVYVLVE